MRLTTPQIVALEILVLMNLLALAMMILIALAERWILPSRLSHSPQPANAVVAGATGTVWATAPATLPPTLPPTLTPLPTPTPEFVASNTPTPVVLQKVQPTVAPTDTALPPPTATPLASTLTSIEKPKVKLLKITGRPQILPLSCEARSAADWAGYFGVAIEELEFFARLPVSDNPEIGFVGNARSWWGQIPPNAYGVHAGPVAALLREYGLNAIAVRDWSADEVKMEIDNDRPLIAWVTGHVAPGKPVEYTAADGQTLLVAPYEHTVIVIGYTADQVMVLDGRQRYWRSWKLFLESWAVLGNMAVAAGP